VTSGDAVDVWGYTVDDSVFATSEIATTTASAARAADSFYWDYTPVPQAMMVYSRFVEAGSVSASGRLWEIGAAGGLSPRLVCYASGGFYTAYHETSAGSVSASLAAAPSAGNTVELVFVLNADGSVEIVQSINSAAITGASSAVLALASAFSDTRLWLNSVGSSFVGSNKFAEVKAVKYADVAAGTSQGRMDELRNLELGPNGELLS
jgi:hypothetical protein